LYSPNGARQTIRSVRSNVIESAADIIEAEDAAVAAGKTLRFMKDDGMGSFPFRLEAVEEGGARSACDM
jgi:hypothetical protein